MIKMHKSNPVKSNLVTTTHKVSDTDTSNAIKSELEIKLTQIELDEIEAYEINERDFQLFEGSIKSSEYKESPNLESLVKVTKEQLKALIIKRPMPKGFLTESLENSEGKKELKNDSVCEKILKEIDELMQFQSLKFGQKLYSIFEQNGFSEFKLVAREFINTQKVEKTNIANVFKGLNIPALTNKKGEFLLKGKTFERGLFIENNPSVRNLTDFTERFNLVFWELSQKFKAYENASNFINKISAADLKKLESEKIKAENEKLKLENEKNAQLVKDIPSIINKMLSEGIESLSPEERKLIGQ